MTADHDVKEHDPYLEQSERLRELLDADPDAAFKELLVLAPQSVSCMLLLGRAYDQGLGTPVDPGQAEEWYTRAAARGSAIGFFYLGDHYLDQRRFKRAREAFSAGAALGDTASKAAIANTDPWLDDAKTAYEHLATDPATGFAALCDFAEKGSVQSMIYLAYAWEEGIGTTADQREAKKWYRQAIEKNPDKAVFYLAHHMYYKGYVAQQANNYAQARECYASAAEAGYAPGIFRLALLYKCGLGGDRRPQEAQRLFEKASSMGNLAAEREVAKQHVLGRYGINNIFNGVRLYARYVREVYAVCMDDPDSIRLLK